MTAEERVARARALRERTAAWREARDQEVALRPGRDAAILDELAAGLTHRAIAAAVGVSNGLPAVVLKSGREMGR